MIESMSTLAERILELLESTDGLDDDEIASHLGVVRQRVNQASRALELRGLVRRETGWRGKIVNRRTRAPTPPPRVAPPPSSIHGLITEDEVKQAMKDYLDADGYEVTVMWGRERGVDIDAHGPNGRILIEAKGEAPTPQMQGNYFLGPSASCCNGCRTRTRPTASPFPTTRGSGDWSIAFPP